MSASNIYLVVFRPFVVIYEKFESVHLFEATFVSYAVHENESFRPSNVRLKSVCVAIIVLLMFIKVKNYFLIREMFA
jgi:hypothetical protein